MTQIIDDQDTSITTLTSVLPPQKKLRERLASLSLQAILLLTSGLYALLMLRDELPVAALIFLALMWVLHFSADRWINQPTPLDVPITGLLMLLPFNLIISADPSMTLTRIYHLLLSFSLFFAIVRLVQFRKHLPALIILLIVLSIGAGFLGLLATEWSSGILGFLSPVYEKLPRLSSFVTDANINKNTIGGALAFFPPLLLSLLWDRSAFRKLASKYQGINKFQFWTYKLLLVFTLGLVLGVIFLTQSRGAWLGTAVGLFIFLVWKDKRFLLAIPIGAFVLFFVLRQDGVSLPELFALLDRGQDASLQGRLDIWTRIISMVRDFPLTGVGMDALNPVYQIFFDPFLFNESPARLYHAHNTLLSVTIEMGIPALILYISLLSAFGAMARRALKGARTISRVLIMGLVCGMVAHQVFGLMDAYPLGKNLGITMWIYLAVMTALYVHRSQMIRSFPYQQAQEPTSLGRGWLLQDLIGLAAWVIFSLLALVLCRVDIYLSLLAAVLSGVFLGVILVNNPLLSLDTGKLPVIT